jgi:hypothetical protein
MSPRLQTATFKITRQTADQPLAPHLSTCWACTLIPASAIAVTTLILISGSLSTGHPAAEAKSYKVTRNLLLP